MVRPASHTRVRLWLGGLASAGVALSHFLAFLVATPDHAARSDLLSQTGHGYWPYFIAVALGALVAGLVGFAGERAWGEADGAGFRSLYRFTAIRLLVLQAVGFLLLEGAERLIVHGSLDGLLSEPVVIIGLLVQAAVALAGALLLVLFVRVVDRVRALFRRSARPPRVALPRGPLAFTPPPLPVAGGGPAPRAPPALP
ncbi:MAG TPA: hypothetical protein VHL78_06555 [Actinomycetota bacterium]|nr:hypothetical protein [Actinomycetota bacterium]